MGDIADYIVDNDSWLNGDSCPYCGGEGDTEYGPCPYCDGTGIMGDCW